MAEEARDVFGFIDTGKSFYNKMVKCVCKCRLAMHNSTSGNLDGYISIYTTYNVKKIGNKYVGITFGKKVCSNDSDFYEAMFFFDGKDERGDSNYRFAKVMHRLMLKAYNRAVKQLKINTHVAHEVCMTWAITSWESDLQATLFIKFKDKKYIIDVTPM